MRSRQILQKAANLLDKAFRNEVRRQGHSLTGALEASIKGDVQETSTSCTIVDYGHIISDGTKPAKIPFSGFNGGGGVSKYIQGLIGFFKLRGLSDKEAKGAAFATAQVQKKEGMSTAASARFSKSGKRQNFIGEVIDANEKALDQLITSGIDDIFETEFNKQKSETV